MEFKLTPVSKEYYNSQIRISKRRGRKKKEYKYDELEIKYYLRKGIDIRPNIKGVD